MNMQTEKLDLIKWISRLNDSPVTEKTCQILLNILSSVGLKEKFGILSDF